MIIFAILFSILEPVDLGFYVMVMMVEMNNNDERACKSLFSVEFLSGALVHSHCFSKIIKSQQYTRTHTNTNRHDAFSLFPKRQHSYAHGDMEQENNSTE